MNCSASWNSQDKTRWNYPTAYVVVCFSATRFLSNARTSTTYKNSSWRSTAFHHFLLLCKVHILLYQVKQSSEPFVHIPHFTHFLSHTVTDLRQNQQWKSSQFCFSLNSNSEVEVEVDWSSWLHSSRLENKKISYLHKESITRIWLLFWSTKKVNSSSSIICCRSMSLRETREFLCIKAFKHSCLGRSSIRERPLFERWRQQKKKCWKREREWEKIYDKREMLLEAIIMNKKFFHFLGPATAQSFRISLASESKNTRN